LQKTDQNTDARELDEKGKRAMETLYLLALRCIELNEAERTCKCPHFVERLKGSGECKHLVRLREFLATGDKTCPCCRGEGCDGCDGLGRVSGSMHPILLEIRRAEDEARNKALLEIFR
jgi:hypothetical protein